ncbi:phage tail protein [Aggregatibacter actinomycetemcomitans]|uniref:phage tail protein n=1 Tax=Aggregatibacter actinomycetemcomitans TaxID=714 RepID=UPI00197BF61D|nr:phage tail protein [Aggregatibacter actinomycetemcomitans]MBN6067881.1 phage tail protein [Aggregatibacter actinomycetemcomitans]MBN6085818.1 phage tail protein [Aggregatibacter actinomycetemcomitans]
MNIKLPFWMDKGELNKIAVLFGKWWDYVQSAVRFPFEILDEEKCSERILNLIAYQRDVERFENEPIELFRKRVKYAFINAKDAGSKAGFIRIFERLGIGYVEIEERFDSENWDVIKIRLTDKQLAKNIDLLNLIIRKYGRTCRRYTFDVITSETLTIVHGEFEHDYQSFYLKTNL